jgi:hypothetical protein
MVVTIKVLQSPTYLILSIRHTSIYNDARMLFCVRRLVINEGVHALLVIDFGVPLH